MGEAQHKHDLAHKGKSRAQIEFQQYKPGDLVMMREMADLSKKREVYVVVKDEGELVEIRKMEKQLRLKTYEVDRDQIFKVFNPTNNNDEEKEGDEKSKNGVKTKNDKEV